MMEIQPNSTLTLTGQVEEIIFHNSDNGYTICDIDGEKEGLFTATGYMPSLSLGEKVSVTGSWVTHPEYGEQFKVAYYETILPSDADSILRYLSSGVISGVREATAKKLLDYFGTKVLDIMLNEPERLAELKGISEERAKKIGESFAELQAMQNIIMFLQQYHITPNMAVAVHNTLGPNAVAKIRENPYILSSCVEGISFKTADSIAFTMGMAKNNPQRILAGLEYILENAAFSQGHTFLPSQSLIDHAVYRLSVDELEVENGIAELLARHQIYQDTVNNDKVYYLSAFHHAEAYVSRRLSSMARFEQKFIMTEEDAEKAIDEIEEEHGIHLAPKQRSAVISSVSCGCMVLTGGPGTGKTTTINTIIRLMKWMKLSISLAAPTGRAAKRMSEVTGLEAKTIHRLLGTTVDNEHRSSFIHDDQNPLTADVIILDEVSMVDILLMSSFLSAVKPGARLILCGDADQLPSVGPGNVLRDIIASETVPVTRLDQIFRQAEQSLIVVNAHRINHGELPELGEKTSDFFFLKRQTQEQVAQTITQLYQSRLPKSYGIDPLSQIQVLSPTKKGVSGTIQLNKTLQLHLNPPDITKEEHFYGNMIFRTGDKVMQIKNNYEITYQRENGENGTGIFNGDMGVIKEISTRDKLMKIIFDEDKEVEYPFSNLDELDLSYAITVHKSQGSEFEYVLIPVCNFAPVLMCRNLLYTAVTRAKDMVILVGSETTVFKMTQNNTERERFTGLCEKMSVLKNALEQEELDKENP